ncbi:hypothetical protein L198_02045 [Cryptococcus wingfieldii CBS 7118]|uniref:Uncharacterized protein n=1 Tax=Cryptococcus wingfieldii CBS 7118 TaxID=1295528 RepID=A0A1E3JZL7_9TREE|nr:hypothetical protein L198_02045 [Cryptococcus wingfieldii CBS 7118]ODO05352.1 hypothetical protein L198_02045 [Cryptococcus wingfieldii CBS 7118]
MFARIILSSFLLSALPSLAADESTLPPSAASTPIAAPSVDPAVYVAISRYQKLTSADKNEGSGDGQKRPYGITGPNEVKFTFGDPVDYKEETFQVTFYETQTTWPAAATETGSDYDQNGWTINQGEPTKVIECVATATASVTEAVDVYPTPDLAITDGPVNVKCTDVS